MVQFRSNRKIDRIKLRLSLLDSMIHDSPHLQALIKMGKAWARTILVLGLAYYVVDLVKLATKQNEINVQLTLELKKSLEKREKYLDLHKQLAQKDSLIHYFVVLNAQK